MKKSNRNGSEIFIAQANDVFDIAAKNGIQCEERDDGKYNCYFWVDVDELVRTILVEGVDGVNFNMPLKTSSYLRKKSFSTGAHEAGKCTVYDVGGTRFIECIRKD